MSEQIKARLLEEIRREREKLDALLAEIGEERMVEPGVAGDWSIKDLLAHLTSWEGSVLDHLQRAVRGEVVSPQATDEMETDAANDYFYKQNRDKPLHEVLAESRRVTAELLALLEALPAKDLTDPNRFHKYLAEVNEGPTSVVEMLPCDSYEHYQEHSEQIRTWLQREVRPSGSGPEAKATGYG